MEVLSYVRPVYDTDSGRILGIIVIDIDRILLKEMITVSSIQNEDRVLVVNPKNEIIINYPYNVIMDDVIKENPILMQQEKVQINAKVFGDDSIIISNTIESTGWKYVQIISAAKIHRETTSLEIISMSAIIASFVLCFILSLTLSKAFTNPISELNKKFKLVENGDLAVRAQNKANDEMGELSTSFNHMVEKLKVLIDSLLNEQKKQSDMEFQILQAQINPHFLYNTLDSIRWLAVINNINPICDMTNALINLLKYNISKSSIMVTLAEELESVVNYVKIQKYKYGDVFDVQYNVKKNTTHCMIPRFILQPIVENSIIHGFEGVEYKGSISINTRIESSKLIIDILDNGSGIDSETLENIANNNYSKKKFSGIGINNIQERIKTYCGDEYGLSFSSSSSGGTKVTLTLPVSYAHEGS
jgi:two-component system, sensor histidine kinase YesM